MLLLLIVFLLLFMLLFMLLLFVLLLLLLLMLMTLLLFLGNVDVRVCGVFCGEMLEMVKELLMLLLLL